MIIQRTLFFYVHVESSNAVKKNEIRSSSWRVVLALTWGGSHASTGTSDNHAMRQASCTLWPQVGWCPGGPWGSSRGAHRAHCQLCPGPANHPVQRHATQLPRGSAPLALSPTIPASSSAGNILNLLKCRYWWLTAWPRNTCYGRKCDVSLFGTFLVQEIISHKKTFNIATINQ